MKFDTPATTNPIDQLKVVGKPVDRIDGPLKTTGTAPYAYERHDVVPNPAYGYVVGSAIAKGRIASMDLTAAKAAPGVLAIVTAENAGKLGKGKFNTAKLLGGPEIEHYHQAIAVVVAETFEQARAAAQLVRVDYVRAEGAFDLAAAKDTAPSPTAITGGPPDTAVGDFAGAFAAAPVQLDATYTTPDQSHAMMEPHASIAAWDGDKLTLWTSNQMIDWSDERHGQDARHRQGEGPPDLAVHRRRLRRQAVAARRRAARGARRARGRTAGEGGAAAAADVQQHHASAGDDPAHPHRRDAATARSPPSAMRAGPATCPAASPRPRSARRGCSMPAPTA